MSLSQRLKAAEYDRRLAAGLPVDHLKPSRRGEAEGVQVDVRDAGAPVIDLTDAPLGRRDRDGRGLHRAVDATIGGRDHGR